ncbi:MAG: endo-1,4-beta-xylanase [Polyangiaceae bacterium]
MRTKHWIASVGLTCVMVSGCDGSDDATTGTQTNVGGTFAVSAGGAAPGIGGAVGAGGAFHSSGIGGKVGVSGGAPSSSVGGRSAAGGAASGGQASSGGTASSVGGASGTTGGISSSGGTTTAGTATSAGGSIAKGGTTATSTVKVCTRPASLKEAGACNGKLIGAALAQSMLNNSNYTTAAKEHNFVTPENEMKWDTVEASRGQFNFGPGNTIVNYATQNGMKVKGHTLVWHSQLPGWVSSLSTASDVRTVMTNHIKTVMNNFKGKIYAWDVVNEAWDTPSKKGDGTATLRNSVFMSKLGKSYIDEAFVAARAADPNALLFYNDYSTEGMNDKSNAVYEMVKSMKERNIPIDGVGIQTHIGTPNDTPTAAEVKQNIDRLAALGLQIMISEMDVNGCDGYTSDSMAKTYHDIVAACVSQPKCTAITFWGISDANSWLNSFSEAGCSGRSPQPLLWDGSYKKKATYTSVIDALTGN